MKYNVGDVLVVIKGVFKRRQVFVKESFVSPGGEEKVILKIWDGNAYQDFGLESAESIAEYTVPIAAWPEYNKILEGKDLPSYP